MDVTGQEIYPLEEIAKRWIEETPLFSVDHAMNQLLLHTLRMEQEVKELRVETATLKAKVRVLEGGQADDRADA